MKLFLWFTALLVFLLVLLQCEQKPPQHSSMCGAWSMIQGTYIGAGINTVYNQDERICYKLISDEHFAVIEMFKANPESLFFAAVGTYKWTDSTYTEIYEAANDPAKVGQSLTFRSSVKDIYWKISLEQEDMMLNETWERQVKMPLPAAPQ
ncbi:MAG TPA: hypothetical protein PLP19_21975 [bacterium]|nr:hypothetical protein [bacterium]HPN46168.1 hypothetical protein [bacterium]